LIEYAQKCGLKNPADLYIRYLNFANSIVKQHGKKAKAWEYYSILGELVEEVDSDIDIHCWWCWDVSEMINAGHNVVNMHLRELYLCPNADYFVDGKKLYETFDPYKFHENIIGQENSHKVAGVGVPLWCDRDAELKLPWSFYFQYLDAIPPLLGEITWGTRPNEKDYDDFQTRVSAVGFAPGFVKVED